MSTTVTDLVEAVAELPELPVVFETSAGIRFALDPEQAPYAHGGFLVIPIVDES